MRSRLQRLTGIQKSTRIRRKSPATGRIPRSGCRKSGCRDGVAGEMGRSSNLSCRGRPIHKSPENPAHNSQAAAAFDHHQRHQAVSNASSSSSNALPHLSCYLRIFSRGIISASFNISYPSRGLTATPVLEHESH